MSAAQEAIDRVRAFVEERESMTGLDPEFVVGVAGSGSLQRLLMSDLRELLRLADRSGELRREVESLQAQVHATVAAARMNRGGWR